MTLFPLRKEAMVRIERITGRPLICYTMKTRSLSKGIDAYIDDGDLIGFSDLIQAITGSKIDVFIISNGGSAEATERIVRLLRNRFESIRYIIPANAYSAATLLSFSGDEIIMGPMATLGPIDPQVNGIPARAILRGFERVEERLKEKGPQALTAYMPLLSKYDLPTLEICRSLQELSEELARTWLSTYMLKCPETDPRIDETVSFFSNYDMHKSHGRSIDRDRARSMNLKIVNLEDKPELADLIFSLLNQYELWYDKSPFYKTFENSYGICWGRQARTLTFQLPPGSIPQDPSQPGPPQRTG